MLLFARYSVNSTAHSPVVYARVKRVSSLKRKPNSGNIKDDAQLHSSLQKKSGVAKLDSTMRLTYVDVDNVTVRGMRQAAIRIE